MTFREVSRGERRWHGFTPGVLLVGDHRARPLLQTALEHRGCAVTFTRDGVDGLALLTQVAPDIVVTGVDVCEFNVVAFCHVLRSLDRGSDLPIVALADTPEDARAKDLRALRGVRLARPALALGEITTTLAETLAARRQSTKKGQRDRLDRAAGWRGHVHPPAPSQGAARIY
jgi:CheY-like chemotaxis protein